MSSSPAISRYGAELWGACRSWSRSPTAASSTPNATQTFSAPRDGSSRWKIINATTASSSRCRRTEGGRLRRCERCRDRLRGFATLRPSISKRAIPQPTQLRHAPQPDQNRLGRVVFKRGGARGTGPLDDLPGEGVGLGFGVLAASAVALKEKVFAPDFGVDALEGRAEFERIVAPDLGEERVALGEHVGKAVDIAQDAVDGFFKARAAAEVRRAIVDQPPGVGVDRQATFKAQIHG